MALTSICSAAIHKISGAWCFRGFPRTLVIGQMSFTSTGYTFRCRGIPTAQASPRSVSPCRNDALSPYPASASTHPMRTLVAIARSISAKAISGLERGVRYSTGTRARFKRDILLVQLSGRRRRKPTITGTSPRASVKDTSVWQSSFYREPSVLSRNTDRALTLLRQRGIINNQHGILTADKSVRLVEQLCLQRPRVPDTVRNKVVQLVVAARGKAFRHRLNPFAIAGTDQSAT
ncbi:hypothetical protein ACVWZK_008523 [Bradyrhizobium sp. GM0.4]